jgi:hypothetical protein
MRVEARVVGQVVINPEEHLTFEHEVVRDADLSGRRLVSFHSIGSRFERCRFERMRIESISFGAGVEVSEYLDCSFDGSRFKRVGGGYSRFVRCSFRDIDFQDWDSDYTELVDCVFTGRLRSAQFWGAPLPIKARPRYESYVRRRERRGDGAPPDAVRALMLRESNEFHGNDFSGADLIEVYFRGGVDLTAQRLPTGGDYLYLPDPRATIDRALALLDERPPDDLTPKVEFLLRDVLGRDLDQGQRQLFLRESDFGSRRGVPAHISVAFDLLRKALS